MRVAVVGGGVSGLAAAHELLATSGGSGVRVTLYEEEDRLGGHARTVDVGDGVQLDLGFMSFSQVGYSVRYMTLAVLHAYMQYLAT